MGYFGNSLGYGNAKSTLQVFCARAKAWAATITKDATTKVSSFRQNYSSPYWQAQRRIWRFDTSRRIGFLWKTNLTADIVKRYQLKNFVQKVFPKQCRWYKPTMFRPAIPIKFKVYDFTDKTSTCSTSKPYRRFLTNRVQLKAWDAPQPKRDVEGMLNNLVARAAKDTLKNPAGAIRTLNTYFCAARLVPSGRQSRSRNASAIVFEAIFGSLLWKRKSNTDKANEVRNVIEGEKENCSRIVINLEINRQCDWINHNDNFIAKGKVMKKTIASASCKI